MSRRLAALLLAPCLVPNAQTQNPLAHFTDAFEARFSPSHPVVTYTLRVDSLDLSGFEVVLDVRNLRDTFTVAMAAHPEYDDRFWRYVEGLEVEAPGGAGRVTRADSAVWRVSAPGGTARLRYRIRLPAPSPPPRPAWVPFLSSTGGLVGGPHSFMYLVGNELAPAHVRFVLPAGWEVATGLSPTADPGTFFAASVDILVDSPVFVGRFRSWRFAVDGVPHRIAYWPEAAATAFDTTAFVDAMARLAREAGALFGRLPYREYTFAFRDSAYGGLEHLNSVILGAPSADLARDPAALLGETAHEYFHTWNLVRIRPAEYRSVDHRTQPPTAGLWFSEGLTMFYADLLLRRAELPVSDSTRVAHLERLMARYLASPGNSRYSAEAVSRVAYNTPPGSLGDYSASVHLQGELLGAMLDIAVRDATDGRRSMDDVMRRMMERFGGARGFTGKDVEEVVEEVCRCDVTPLFEAHVRRGGTAIEFDRYLGLLGLRSRVTGAPAVWEGAPERDLRIFAWEPPGQAEPSLLVTDPASIWGKAGLHTGDRLVAVNGAPVKSWPELRAILRQSRIGDTMVIDVRRPQGPFQARVTVAGFDRPVVRLEELPEVTPRQRSLRAAWIRGEPLANGDT